MLQKYSLRNKHKLLRMMNFANEIIVFSIILKLTFFPKSLIRAGARVIYKATKVSG